MLAPILMGIVGGQRGMTPLAAVAIASARGELPDDNGAPKLISNPLVAAGLLALAAAEYAGDKQETAPDRIIPIGLAVRFVTSAIAGAALTGKDRRWIGAALGGLTAVIRGLSWMATAGGDHDALRTDRHRLRRGSRRPVERDRNRSPARANSTLAWAGYDIVRNRGRSHRP